ncbi:MAG: hypothetical protein EAX91_00790 [Candidatus Lokiarchaeota archaeon]|nr:hypothetical protein [Candidatus Lokiarchaeota archaeon]
MSNTSVNKEFHDFGKFIQVSAILTIVSLATGIAGLIALIFIFVALKCIKRANYSLNNSSLQEFRSRYIRGFISKISGMAILLTGVANLVLFFFIPSAFPFYFTLSLSVVLMISGIVFVYVGVAAEMNAWKNLKMFFENNNEMFPAQVSSEAIKGCEKLRTGALLTSLGFLIVPAIIGFIYQVKGYFKLATLNKLSIFDAPKAQEQQIETPKPQVVVLDQDSKIKFCPNCGAELSRLGRFCALCGSEIK